MHSCDVDLVKAVLSRDPHAVDKFVNKFAPRIYKVVKSLGRMFRSAEEDIEDYCQEVILHVLRNLEKWSPEGGELPSWVAKVAKNKTLDNIKRTLRERTFLTSIDADESEEQDDFYNLLDILHSCDLTPEEEIIEEEGRLWIRSAITALSAAHQEVIVRYYYHGQSYNEIATALNMSATKVTMRLHHARRALAKRLEDYFFEG